MWVRAQPKLGLPHYNQHEIGADKMRKRIYKMLIGWLVVLIVCVLSACAYLQQPKFGKLPEGERLARIEKSPNYKESKFQNLSPTPQLSSDSGMVGALLKFIFSSSQGRFPPSPIPSTKTDLNALDINEDIVVWLGHSSYFIQLGGRRILIDPVFSPYAAPVSFFNKAFAGTNVYSADAMPPIDYMIISHDHWDHLDYPSVTALKSKVKNIITPLGVGAHLEYWGFATERIREADWFDELKLEDDFAIHVLPARHFSGRLFTRDKTLWAAFALITPERKIFFSGDSGYDTHFAEIGRQLGGVDLAILECGQYDQNWRYIHMLPEQVAQAALDLKAGALIPAHSGKFSIAYHSWDDPFVRLSAASEGKPYRLLTPMIGEAVKLRDKNQTFSRWWKNMK
jgi:L-ascorbate metabolism protein UlaG (beta-lactamase superfamily)